VSFVRSLENTVKIRWSLQAKTLRSVMPARRAGIQADIDVSGASLQTWMPAIRAGMTEAAFSFPWASVGEG